MTLEQFRSLRVLQDRRVRLSFSDGQAFIATLLSVTTDFDGSRHLIYDKVEWSAQPHLERDYAAGYAAGEDLVSCVECNTETEI